MTRPRFLFEKSAEPVGESRDSERAAVMQPFESQNESRLGSSGDAFMPG